MTQWYCYTVRMKGARRRLLTPRISTSPMGFLASGTSSQNIAFSINLCIKDLICLWTLVRAVQVKQLEPNLRCPSSVT